MPLPTPTHRLTLSPTALQELKQILQAQLPLHHTILEAMLTKKVAVLSNNLQALQEIDAYLKSCRKQLQASENKRQAWCESQQLPANGLRLEAIIAQLEPQGAERSEWLSLHLELQNVLHQIDKASVEVQDLLALSMNWVKRSIDTIRKAATPESGQLYTGVTARGGNGFATKPKTPSYQVSLHQKEA